MMNWSFAKTFLRTDSFLGVVGAVIAIANAPVFQNIGVAECKTAERYSLIAFYLVLILALLALFFCKIFFEFFCPDLIKRYDRVQDYIASLSESDQDDDLLRSELGAAWKTQNADRSGFGAVRILLITFLVCFPLAFYLAAQTLIIFGHYSNPCQPEHQSECPPCGLPKVQAEKGAESLALSNSVAPSDPPYKPSESEQIVNQKSCPGKGNKTESSNISSHSKRLSTPPLRQPET